MSRLNVDKITGATGTASGAPITLSGDTATLGSGADIKGAINASGTAPIYACRAWVNFNGTGTVAIRDSGNVSSITDRGTGLYRINLTTDMPDENYSFVASTSRDTSTSQQITQIDGTTFTASACGIRCMDTGNTDRDAHFACIAILR